MDVSKLVRQRTACREFSIPPATLALAIKRGEIRTYPTACGLPLVLPKDVERWKATDRPTGAAAHKSRNGCGE